MIFSIVALCCDSRILKWGGGGLMIIIGGRGGDYLCAIGAVFIYLCFGYCLEFSEIVLAAGVAFFGALGGGI